MCHRATVRLLSGYGQTTIRLRSDYYPVTVRLLSGYGQTTIRLTGPRSDYYPVDCNDTVTEFSTCMYVCIYICIYIYIYTYIYIYIYTHTHEFSSAIVEMYIPWHKHKMMSWVTQAQTYTGTKFPTNAQYGMYVSMQAAKVSWKMSINTREASSVRQTDWCTHADDAVLYSVMLMVYVYTQRATSTRTVNSYKHIRRHMNINHVALQSYIIMEVYAPRHKHPKGSKDTTDTQTGTSTKKNEKDPTHYSLPVCAYAGIHDIKWDCNISWLGIKTGLVNITHVHIVYDKGPRKKRGEAWLLYMVMPWRWKLLCCLIFGWIKIQVSISSD